MAVVNYFLDQKSFKDYNVLVSDSSNLLDKPSFKEGLSKSWDNEHGYDIDLNNRYLEAKTITLDCFIPSSSKIECITQYNNFLNAIDKKGSRRLSVLADTLRLEFQVFRVDSVEVNLTYDDTNKVGVFKLKLVENMPIKRVLEFSNLNLVSTYQTFYNEYFDLLNRSEIGGRNLFLNSEVINLNTYSGASVTKIQNQTINFESAATNKANRYITNGGSDIMKLVHYSPYRSGALENGKVISISFYVKNFSSKKMEFFSNQGNKYTTIEEGSVSLVKWEGIVGNGVGVVHIQAKALDVADSLDFAIWRVKTEYGNKCTDWTPAPEDIRNDCIASLTTISSDNIVNSSEKQTFKTHYNNTQKLYSELLSVNNPTSNLISYYSNLTQLSDYILRDSNVSTSINTSATTITINSPKVLVINWGDGTEQYTTPGNKTYTKTYTTQRIYYPLILGDIDSITSFNTNCTIVWNKF